MQKFAAIMSLCALVQMAVVGPSRADVALTIGYLEVAQSRPPTLSNLDAVPSDIGLAGARTGLADNNTTGKFLGHDFALEPRSVPVGEDPLGVAADMLRQSPYLILDAAPDVLIAIADLPQATGAILFNISAGDTTLRDTDCRANVLHAMPSDAMRTDALAQVLVQKRWTDLVMVTGVHAGDLAYAEAVRRSLVKFGLRLAAEKQWAFDADMRRNASQEVPLFTQEFGDYHALIVADEVGDFGRYLLYNTWVARPVIGSEGMTAVTWSPVIEQWGAAQLQNRFREQNGRAMQSQDYAAWAAVRTLGEAATRTDAADAATLRAYILSEDFELAGFKGRPLTYRNWNGQLRQPIAIVHPRALVDQPPLDGFLHQSNELDTLGLDRPESRCEVFE